MKKIGGFFELEIAEGKSLFHDDAIKLSTGRACLNLILQTKKYSKVYLPFYCCDALFEPLDLHGISYKFYAINEQLEIGKNIDLKSDEAIIYCNFFGIKSNYVNQLIKIYKNQLIIDNSHAFFIKGYKNNISYTTARKYFGVPDGAFLYYPKKEIVLNLKRNIKVSVDHNLNRLLGLQETSYQEFVNYEESIDSTINKISIVSEKILRTVNYSAIIEKRNRNYKLYKEELKGLNKIRIDDNAINCFCYPLLLDKPLEKQELYDENFFIPSYWLDVVKRNNNDKFQFENKLSKDLLPLPIDHRYTKEDLMRVINFIKKRRNE
ncbi:hypothetical protein KO566_11805 [Flavobacteriaceae bacterium XHP0103]|uniref:hypothetical protein n=1 Tax=Marixanthotalea marina TaxID=2844359 RepID=UPI002989AAEB|nr:hypothetical protein [Marixanthotalea marina]MBU3822750.1 hypothetical protein [Marixanthotalea marina]